MERVEASRRVSSLGFPHYKALFVLLVILLCINLLRISSRGCVCDGLSTLSYCWDCAFIVFFLCPHPFMLLLFRTSFLANVSISFRPLLQGNVQKQMDPKSGTWRQSCAGVVAMGTPRQSSGDHAVPQGTFARSGDRLACRMEG